MALAATTILDCRNGGADTNSAGFNPANSNFATDGAATSATGSSPVFTSASYTFVAGDVGYHVYIKAGTNWTPGWYLIASVAAGAATLTASVGSVILADTVNFTGRGVNTVAGVATTASPTGATWGVDYSQNTACPYAFTDIAVGGTNTQFTSAAKPVGKNFVGNLINITGGAGFTVQVVEVVSTSTTTGTVDKTFGGTSLSGGTGNMGGAAATPGGAAALAGSTLNGTLALKYHASDYSSTSSTNVAGGCISGQQFKNIFGWSTNRWQWNTDANRPTIAAGSNSMTNLTVSGGQGQKITNLITSANGKTGTSGFNLAPGVAGAVIANCKAGGTPVTGFTVTDALVVNCTTDATTTAFTGSLATFVKCAATGTASTVGFDITNRGVCISCVCSGGGNFRVTGTYGGFANCVAYNTTNKSGFRVASTSFWAVNCIVYGITGSGNFGFQNSGSKSYGIAVINCAAGNNTGSSGGGDYDTTSIWGNEIYNLISLTADPFTNAAGNDFSLNSTAGGGALLRELGYPATLPGLSTNDYSDVNAVARSVAGAAGGMIQSRVFTGF